MATSYGTKQQMQTCSFRDFYEWFKKISFEIVGVSGDIFKFHRVLDVAS